MAKKKKSKGKPRKGVVPAHLRPYLFKKGGGRGGRGGGKVAKGRRRGSKQGVVSWVRAIIALWLAFFRPITLLFSGELATFQSEASMGFSEGAFDKAAAMRMYGPMIGGLLFYKVSGELTNRIRLRTLVPALPSG